MTALQETIALLKANGYVEKRRGKGSHVIYYNPRNGKTIPVKTHRFTEDTRDYILKEAGIKRNPR